MTDARDANGNLLPDEERLGKFGKALRGSSMDELLEAFNILKGDMSIIGPRPQLVRDMVFMSDEQRMRHTAKPGLSGLAQVMGRNAITWEDKLDWDLKYIEKVSFWNDLKILLLTVKKVIGHSESSEELDVTDDFGDALLKAGKVSKEKYESLQDEAKHILSIHARRK
jgi:lipopolysaccharide/colanic/teichoic acid biosynthesis glycosyltransferase